MVKHPEDVLAIPLVLPTPFLIDKPLFAQATLQSTPVVALHGERRLNPRVLVTVCDQVCSRCAGNETAESVTAGNWRHLSRRGLTLE